MPIPIPDANIEFDPEVARGHIAGFNGVEGYLAGEWLARDIFRNLESSRASTMVVALNALMKARASVKDQALISGKLMERWDDVVIALERLPVDMVGNDPDTLCAYADRVLPMLVEIEGQGARNYVFATKLLHWVSQGGTPIIDSKARDAIVALQQAYHGEPNEAAIIPEYWQDVGFTQDYRHWVRFYCYLVNGLPLNVKEDLIERDWATQHDVAARWAARNSLVRVLDKYFWRRGAEGEEE